MCVWKSHVYTHWKRCFLFEKQKSRQNAQSHWFQPLQLKANWFSLQKLLRITYTLFRCDLLARSMSTYVLAFLCSYWTKLFPIDTPNLFEQAFLSTVLPSPSFCVSCPYLIYCPESFRSFPHALLAVIQQSKRKMHPFKLSSAASTVPLHIACIFHNVSTVITSLSWLPLNLLVLSELLHFQSVGVVLLSYGRLS